jgi:hypothetical protein
LFPAPAATPVAWVVDATTALPPAAAAAAATGVFASGSVVLVTSAGAAPATSISTSVAPTYLIMNTI